MTLLTPGTGGTTLIPYPVPFVGFSEHLPACLARVKERPEAAAEAVAALVPFLTEKEAKAMGAEAALLWRVFVDEEYRDDGSIRVCRVGVPRGVVEAESAGAVDVCLGDAVHRAVWRDASGKAEEDARNVEFCFFARREDVDASGGKATVRCDGRPLQKKKQVVVCWDVAEPGLGRLREERGFSSLASMPGQALHQARLPRAIANRGNPTPWVTAVIPQAGTMGLTLTFTFPGVVLRPAQGGWLVEEDGGMLTVTPPPKTRLQNFLIAPIRDIPAHQVKGSVFTLTGKNSVTLVLPLSFEDPSLCPSHRTTLCYMQLRGPARDERLFEGLRAQAAAERGVPMVGVAAAQLELFERAHRNAGTKEGYDLEVKCQLLQYATIRPRAILVERDTLVPCLDATVTETTETGSARSDAIVFDVYLASSVRPLMKPERRLWGRSQVRPLTDLPLIPSAAVPGNGAAFHAKQAPRVAVENPLAAMWHYYYVLKAHREGACAAGFEHVVNACVNASVLLYRELQTRMAWEWEDFPAAEWAGEAVRLLQEVRKHWGVWKTRGHVARGACDAPDDRWLDVAEGTAQLRLALALEVVGEGATDRARAAVRGAAALLPGDAGVAAALDRLCCSAADAGEDNDADDAGDGDGDGDGAVVSAAGGEERWMEEAVKVKAEERQEEQVEVEGGFCAGGVHLIPDRVLRKHDVVAKAAVVLGWFAPAWGDLECIDLLREWWNEQSAQVREKAVAYEPTALPWAVQKQVMEVSVAGFMEDVFLSFGTPSCDACDADCLIFKVNSDGMAKCPTCEAVLREV